MAEGRDSNQVGNCWTFLSGRATNPVTAEVQEQSRWEGKKRPATTLSVISGPFPAHLVSGPYSLPGIPKRKGLKLVSLSNTSTFSIFFTKLTTAYVAGVITISTPVLRSQPSATA